MALGSIGAGLGHARRAARATVVEVAWLGAHAALYPLGLIGEQTRAEFARYNLHDLQPAQRGLVVGDVEAAGTPILLIHGMVDNRSVFTVLRRGLRRRGFNHVTSLNYSPLSADLREVALQLAMRVEKLCNDTGYEKVHLIGHSMGGLVARYYVQCMGGDGRVDTCVTLGTPHGGTVPARFVPHPVARQLRPGSDLIRELALPAPDVSTRFVAIWSDHDQMVIPTSSARLDHPDLDYRNVFIRGVGHISLPIDGRVVHEISTALAHLDQPGGSVPTPARLRMAGP